MPDRVAVSFPTKDAAGNYVPNPFQEQLDFARQKLNLPTERWDDIKRAAHDRAFIVAGAMKADLLNDLRLAVDKAIEQGTGYDQFHKDFKAIVAKHGWTGWTGEGTKAGEAWRTRVIYQTNMATSYAAGRYKQLTDPDFLTLRPYWRYKHADWVQNPRLQHVAWNDLTLPHDHPFWQSHFPPNGWGCHCRVTPVDATEYEKAQAAGKGEPPAGWDSVDAKTGAPKGIAKGFDYAPGANVATPWVDLIGQKLISLPSAIGAAMMDVLRPALLAEQIEAFSAFVDATIAAKRTAGRMITVGALKDSWIDAATKAELTPQTADITVRDADIWHTFRDAKTERLDLEWYKTLPSLLLTPDAVILDTTKPDAPAFLLIYGDATATNKIVVRINYRIKKVGIANIVETGKPVDPSGIRAMIGHGYELVEGNL